MAAVKQHPIVVAGCGPGSPDFLTPAVRRAVEGAEVLVGAKRLLELFPESAAEKIAVGADVEQALRAIDERRSGKKIVVLVTGDPGLCSLARPVIDRFGRGACRVIPGVSSVQAAFARLGLDWTDARIIDAHREDPAAAPEGLRGVAKIAVLAGRQEAFRWVARLAEAIGDGYRIYVCEDLTLAGEKVSEVGKKDLGVLRFSPRCVVLFIREDVPR